jgi:hypothetical protein
MDITPEQKLLQCLISTSIDAIVAYHKTGRIPAIKKAEIKQEYRASLAFLKALNEEMIITAGFKKVVWLKQTIKELTRNAEVISS